jgi:hypothetical protein
MLVSRAAAVWRISLVEDFDMRWPTLFVCILLMLPAAVRAQGARDPSPEEPRWSVTTAAGSHLKDGGDLQAIAFGFTPVRRLALVLNVERNHVPTRVDTYPNGYSATRGSTVTTVSGELRVSSGSRRVEPFGFVGTGVGRSRLNVNERFPDAVTNTARSFYAGGGVLIPVARAFALSIDAKFVLLAEAGESGAMAPVRAGVVWRF